jgi:phosphoglycolate phosphatase
VEILFDLDGTLTDPGTGIARCIQHALGRLGQPIPHAQQLLRFVGPPLRGAFAELLHTQDDELVSMAVAYYRERFESVGMFENSVYPDIPGALEELRGRGHRLWVATSKPELYARRILEHFGLARWFEEIHGSDLSGRNSEKGELIRSVLLQERLDPVCACMVGDRAQDVRGARDSGVMAVAVAWGYGGIDELEATAPDRIVRSPGELCDYLGWPAG